MELHYDITKQDFIDPRRQIIHAAGMILQPFNAQKPAGNAAFPHRGY